LKCSVCQEIEWENLEGCQIRQNLFPRRSNIQERSVTNEADQRIDRKRLSWKNAEKHKTESIKEKNVQKKSYEPDKSVKKDVENLVCPIERKTTKISDKLNTIQRLYKFNTVS